MYGKNKTISFIFLWSFCVHRHQRKDRGKIICQYIHTTRINKSLRARLDGVTKLWSYVRTLRTRWGELMRHLALQRGSLRSAPWRSSSVANPPSRTAQPPHFSRKSLMNDDVSTSLGIPIGFVYSFVESTSFVYWWD